MKSLIKNPDPEKNADATRVSEFHARVFRRYYPNSTFICAIHLHSINFPIDEGF